MPGAVNAAQWQRPEGRPSPAQETVRRAGRRQSRRLGNESRQHVADEIDEPVADHIGHEVVAPDEEEGEDAAEDESDQDVGPAAAPSNGSILIITAALKSMQQP